MSPIATTTRSARPLPAMVTAHVAFSTAWYLPDGSKQQNVQHGPVAARLPLASAFKTMLLNAVLNDVDAGRLKLDQLFETTDANQSSEDFPPERISRRDGFADPTTPPATFSIWQWNRSEWLSQRLS